MKVIFYKAKYGDIIDNAVSLYTRGPYSHCELYFEDMNMCYSCSPRENQVRFKYIQYMNNPKWDVIDLISYKYNHDTIYRLARQELNKKYDWVGLVLSQIIPLNIHDPSRWFCSELCAYLLGFKDPAKYNPNNLFKTLTIFTTHNKLKEIIDVKRNLLCK